MPLYVYERHKPVWHYPITWVIVTGLSHLASRPHLPERSGDAERAVEVEGREYHAQALYAHHLAGREVGDEQHVLAHELLGLVELRDAGENGAVGAAAVVDGKQQELVRLPHCLAVLDVAHAYVGLLPLVKRNVGLHRLCLIVLGGLCGLVGLLCGGKLVELALDGIVLNLLEEQMRLTELMARLEEVGVAQLGPVKLVHANHSSEVILRHSVLYIFYLYIPLVFLNRESAKSVYFKALS